MSRGSASEKSVVPALPRPVGASSFALLGRACWAWNFHVSRVQKEVTLDTALDHLGLARWAWNFHDYRVQKVTLDDVRHCGLWPGKTGETFRWVLSVLFSVSEGFDIDHLRPVGASSSAPLGHACWAWHFHFSPVQKMTLDTAACGLGGPAKHSAECCFPILRRSTHGLKTPPATSTLGHSCFCHVPGLPVA